MPPMNSQSNDVNASHSLNKYSIIIVSFISLSSAAYGYAGAIIATTLTQPSFSKTMGLDTSSNATALIGAINAMYFAGGVFGSFLAGWVCDRYGRKASVAMGNAITLIAAAVLTGSVNPAMFIVFRFVIGLGSFQILSSVPMWVAELAPPKIRGIMVDVHTVLLMVGYMVAAYVGLGFYFVPGNDQWRGPIGLTMALPLIILCGIYWMPESPRYLIAKNRKDEAWDIVRKLHASSKDPDCIFAHREFYQMKRQNELDKTLATSYWTFFVKPSLRKRMMITISLEFFIMSSGVLVILNNGSTIWASLGFETVQILNFQAGFQLCGLVFNLIGMTFVDRVKRNRLIAIGLMGCAIVMAVEATLQRFYLEAPERKGLIAAATMIFLFQTVYSLFIDGATFFYIAEIWPGHLRSKGYAVGIATLSLTNLIWLQGANTALVTIGWKYYLFFIFLPAIGSVIVWFYYPDTLHKPLEEIAAIFGDEDMVVVYQRDLEGSNVIESSTGDMTPSKTQSREDAKGNVELIEAV